MRSDGLPLGCRLAALDVDRDGWPDLFAVVCGTATPGRAAAQPFERIVFDEAPPGRMTF